MLGKALKRHFLTGLLILGPISITLIVIRWLVVWVDDLLTPLTGTVVSRYIPGFGVLMALLLILLTGFAGSNIAGRHILAALEDLLLHIPVFNWFYGTVRQLAAVFSPGSQLTFKSVVLVEYPQPKVFRLGLVTNSVAFLRDGAPSDGMVCVFIPTNHLYIGDVILVPKEKVIKTELILKDGLQCILTAGAALPNEMRLPAQKE